jgi:hypothetical protein
MKICGLNCRGLGNEPAVQALLEVQRQCYPQVFFLSETHLDVYPAECLRRRLKMDFKTVQRSDGRKGGVILFWKREVNVQLLFSAPTFIDVKVIESDKQWRFTGIYGEFRWQDKHLTWQRMRGLKDNHDLLGL